MSGSHVKPPFRPKHEARSVLDKFRALASGLHLFLARFNADDSAIEILRRVTPAGGLVVRTILPHTGGNKVWCDMRRDLTKAEMKYLLGDLYKVNERTPSQERLIERFKHEMCKKGVQFHPYQNEPWIVETIEFEPTQASA